ncbi:MULTISPECIES: hypothetical protein [Hwangdonia]|uniref:Outer membrane protein beta-barrel domain-containing protein n=1 Tax=Hwangdonia seohaensis TaxID=1240727 RepID=A0ABW3R928_9FLAO|nr:hypothetical protein [Hwangdonia seohaensis]
MKNQLLLFCLFIISFYGIGQNDADSTQVKQNPIIYGDFMIGGAGGEARGLSFVFDLNYQFNKDLITFRSLHLLDKNEDVNFFEAIFIFPIYMGGDSMNEFSLLYGKRFIFDGSALSISAGVSQNLRKFEETINNTKVSQRSSYIGIPFEVNFNSFKRVKKRYRIVYGLIPIGKPTSFGRSIGFKLFGNFGKFNYFGLGINFGWGWHKKY